MQENMIVETRNLVKIYKMDSIEVRALNGVNLHVHKGEFVSIMGPSGSGKSTLLHLVGALDRPTEGEVIIDGEDIFHEEMNLDDFRNRKIGFIFQLHNLIPTLTALENVEIPAFRMPRDERRKKAEEMLSLVGLGDRMHHKPTQLSGGQRQRIAIARALMNDPSIILADEPTGELDSKSGAEIIELLLSLNRNYGKTFVMVTHNPEMAQKTDRIIYLRDGLFERDEHLKRG
jgi:putative ABC transport system ATP-binding protein